MKNKTVKTWLQGFIVGISICVGFSTFVIIPKHTHARERYVVKAEITDVRVRDDGYPVYDLEDETGNLWSIFDGDFQEGDLVEMTINTSGTLNEKHDDIIENVELMKR